MSRGPFDLPREVRKKAFFRKIEGTSACRVNISIWFSSQTWNHIWVEFVVGSLLSSERFFSGPSSFPLFSKTNISKFQLYPGMLSHLWMSSCMWTPLCSRGKQIYITCLHICANKKEKGKLSWDIRFKLFVGLYSRRQTDELINRSLSGKSISGYYTIGGFMCCLKKETFQACMFNAGNWQLCL